VTVFKQLCRGRPPEWWTPEDVGARLALALCRACPTLARCPDGDPHPHGVIRAAVAYSDAGKPLPTCPCGYPDTAYTGGTITACGRCRVPDVPIPDPVTVRRLAVKLLARGGLHDQRIAAELGVSRRTARALRYQVGVRYRRGGQPREVAA
jgi:hypothetical protein